MCWTTVLYYVSSDSRRVLGASVGERTRKTESEQAVKTTNRQTESEERREGKTENCGSQTWASSLFFSSHFSHYLSQYYPPPPPLSLSLLSFSSAKWCNSAEQICNSRQSSLQCLSHWHWRLYHLGGEWWRLSVEVERGSNLSSQGLFSSSLNMLFPDVL